MSLKHLKKWVVIPLLAVGAAWLMWALLPWRAELIRPRLWQTAVSPGKLSAAHASLQKNCAACHTPNKGVEAANCIVCHANDQSLLQRQPTAFHADVQSCTECHTEHRGTNLRPTQMDHAALARLGLGQLKTGSAAVQTTQIAMWINQHSGIASLPPGQATATPEETALNCSTCHANQDLHRGFFGGDCIQCHTTNAWSIMGYRHPSPASTSCVQCHQAPPSHYMMHFKMVSMMVAHQEHARVDQCFLCHQTTSWNDIQGVGWYKHH